MIMSSFAKRDNDEQRVQDPNIARSAPRSVEASPIGQPMTATDARQGRRGSPVLIVLIAGLVLAVIAWGGSEWWGKTTAPPPEQTAKPPASSSMAPVNPNAQPPSTP
jgi:hypothetical protein